MSRGAKAQTLVDQDSGSSERVTGTDLFDNGVWSASSGNSGVLGFATVATTLPSQFTNLTPSLISTRLQAIEEMYQWYAIRRLKIHFISAVGTGTIGSAAFGISTDPELSVAFSTPTQQQVVELNPSVLMPVWSISSIEYRHLGTKLWETYASSTEIEDTKIQATLFVSGKTSVALTQILQIWIEYEIDFYQQAPLLSSVDLFRLGRSCPRCRQLVACDPRERKQKVRKSDHDDYVVLRTQEPSTGVFQGLPTYQGLEPSPLRRDESKAHSTTRSVSSKG
jgi:hypothetical protein